MPLRYGTNSLEKDRDDPRLYDYYDEEKCKYYKVTKTKLLYLQILDCIINLFEYFLIILVCAFILMLFLYFINNIRLE